jgi:uncharacterized protein involved in response to NO
MPEPISERSTVRDILLAYPDAEPIFERHGLVGCGGPNGPLEPLGFFARIHRVDPDALVRELNQFVGGRSEERGQPARPAPGHGRDLYPFFLATSLTLALVIGLVLGLAALWQITLGLALPVDWNALVEVHGHVQVYGFVALFLAGVALHVVPRFRGRVLQRRRAALAVLPLFALGALARASAQLADLPVVLLGSAALEVGGTACLIVALADPLELRASRGRGRSREAWEPWVVWGLGWLGVAGALDAALAARLALSGAAWTPPSLIDPFLHAVFYGFVGSFVGGVALRTLPVFMGLRQPRYAQTERAFVLWQVGVGLTVAVQLAAAVENVPATGTLRSLTEAGVLLGATLELIALLLFVAAIGLYERVAERDVGLALPRQYEAFVRSGFGWLAIALGLTVLVETGATLTGRPAGFSHVQALRHAVALGFVAQLMLGMASRIVPVFSGRALRWTPLLWLGFVALNAGALLRVVPEFLVGYAGASDAPLAISGAVAFVGIGAAAGSLGGTFLWRRGETATPAVPARVTPAAALGRPTSAAAPLPEVPTVSPAQHRMPLEITAATNVGALLDARPDLLPILIAAGFAPLAEPALRASLAPSLTLQEACRLRGLDLDVVLQRLAAAGAASESRPDPRRFLVERALRSVYDPEIPVNIVDLGLVRGTALEGSRVRVRLTLTAPGCPSGPAIEADLREALRNVPGVDEVAVELELDPPWSFEQMSPAGKAALGWN